MVRAGWRGLRAVMVVVGLAGVVAIAGRHGLSFQMSQLTALGLFMLAAVIVDLAMSGAGAAARRGQTPLLVVALVVTAAGVVLWNVPAPRVVLIEWPCRPEQWTFEAARDARDGAGRRVAAGGDPEEARRLAAVAEAAWDALAACRERGRGK